MKLARKLWLVAASVYLLPLLRGIFCAVSWLQPIRFFYNVAAAKQAFWKCFVLNGALFLGSMGMMHYFLSPALRSVVGGASELVVGLVSDSPTTDNKHSDSTLTQLQASADVVSSAVFHALWLYPVYCISFILNAEWYQEVADEAQKYFCPGRKTAGTSGMAFLKMVRDEIFRLLLVVGFVVQASVCGMAPGMVGQALQFASYSWLFSFYCFEYCWAAKGWRLLHRTRHFQRNWLFYLGFGAPGAAATTFFPLLINGGVYALIFPIFIAVGASCDASHLNDASLVVPGTFSKVKSVARSGASPTHQRPTRLLESTMSVDKVLGEFRFSMPIFWFPTLLANNIVRIIQLCCCTRWESSAKKQPRSQSQGRRPLSATTTAGNSQPPAPDLSNASAHPVVQE